jgi:serine/threonine protein kinase
VYLALNKRSGELMAVKQLEVTDVSASDLAAMEHEVLVLQQLKHRNIVRFAHGRCSSRNCVTATDPNSCRGVFWDVRAGIWALNARRQLSRYFLSMFLVAPSASLWTSLGH